MKQGIGRILVLLSAILLSMFLICMMPANGFMADTDFANRTLSILQKNLTSSMVSLAINQLNDSMHSSETRDRLSDLEMSYATIRDLVIGLSYNKDKVDFVPYEISNCVKPPVDCIIRELESASDSLANNRLNTAQEVLQTLYSQIK